MCGTLHTLLSGYRNNQVPGSERDVTVICEYKVGTAAVKFIGFSA
jgi:hypothetical protein